jgi:hypothetical protein
MSEKISQYAITATSFIAVDLFDVSKKISSGPDVYQTQKFTYATLLTALGASFVDFTSTQTIDGLKTFSNTVKVGSYGGREVDINAYSIIMKDGSGRVTTDNASGAHATKTIQTGATSFTIYYPDGGASNYINFEDKTGYVALNNNIVYSAGLAQYNSAGLLILNNALSSSVSAPTAAPGTNSSQLATTAFVQTALGYVISGTGTAGKHIKWLTSTTLGDSIISESGTVATVTGSLTSNFYSILGTKVLAVSSDNASIYLGSGAGANNTGFGNNFTGKQAGYNNVSGSYNVFNGYQSGFYNTTGNGGTFIGYNAGYNNTTGSFNVYNGNQSGYNNTTGLGNVYLGYQAGYNNSTGDNSLFLGRQAGFNETTGGKLYIANNSTSTLIYGDFISGFLGLGNNTTPTATLDVIGTIRFQTNAVNGYMFTTDGSGNATWVSPNTGIQSNTAALSVDWGFSHLYKTLSANSTFTFSGAADGKTIIVAITNTVGNFTVTWPSVDWGAAGAPVQRIGAVTDIYTFTQINGVIYGSARQ